MVTVSEGSLSNAWFPHQADLPPLPVPELADTCRHYLDSVKPLLSEAEWAHTQAVVADFQREGGVGEQLQAVLHERAATHRNWVEEWWEQLAYLRSRTTMAVHMNWFGVLPDWGLELDAVQAAGLLLSGMLEYKARLEAGKVDVEKIAGNALDMHQFSRFFGMTRVPAEGADVLVQEPDAKHIVILRDGAAVAVPVYDSAGRPLAMGPLMAQLRTALALADGGYLEDQSLEADDAHVNLSVLTGCNRDAWAGQRAKLLEEPTCAASLTLVEGALLHVAFERGVPTSKEDIASITHGGGCAGRNRWFDKSLTAVVFENGRGGLNAEHTPVDAMTMISMFLDVLGGARKALASPSRGSLFAAGEASSALPPQLLRWKLSADLQQAVDGGHFHVVVRRGLRCFSARSAEDDEALFGLCSHTAFLIRQVEFGSQEIAALATDVQIKHLAFSHFGKALVKRCKLHPDFFIQMTAQLAMWRLHREFVATYETGTTRAFFHGRTDTVRTLSSESVAWVQTMENVSASASDKFAALKAACVAHGVQLQRVLSGQGIDRHLLGLMIAAYMRGDDPLPALFTDVAYTRSGGGGNYRLSTSNVGYTPTFGGFAPMTNDGYGLCYALLENRMNIAITAWRSNEKTDAHRLCDAMSKALLDVASMCTAAAAEAASSKL